MNFQLRNMTVVYWTVGSVFFGVLTAPLFYNANPILEISASNDHKHPWLPVDEKFPIPSVTVEAQPDSMSGWNIFLKTKNFEFTPQKVGTPPVPNEGHAHLYINGEKIARVYDNYYHFGNLLPGEYEIKATLHGNNHGYFVHNGEIIGDTIRIHQKLKKL